MSSQRIKIGLQNRLYALIAAGFVVRLGLITWTGYRNTIAGFVPDDAFYYFVIARNILSGLGSTFDSLAPTNGYHPLWMTVLLPVFAFLTSRIGAVLAVMTLGSLVWVSGGFVLASLTGILTRSNEVVLSALVLYLFGPFPLLFSLDGLETSLVAFISLTFLWWVARGYEQPTQYASRKYFLVYGVLAGLLVLTRTDSAIPVIALSTVVAFNVKHRVNARRSLLSFTVAVLMAGIIFAPWLIWNYITFGEIIQVSGKASPFIFQTYVREVGMWTSDQMLIHSLTLILNSSLSIWRFCGVWIPPGLNLGYWMIAGTLLLGAAGFFVLRRHSCWRIHGKWLSATVLSLIVLISLQAGVRWSVQSWYWVMPVILSYLLLALVLEMLMGHRVLFITSGITVLMLIGHARILLVDGFYPYQVGWWQKLCAGARSWPAGSRVGITDAGMEAYFADDFRVVNLDGLVNNRIIEYYRRGTGMEYIDDLGIDYIYAYIPEIHPVFMGPAGIRLEAMTGDPFGIEHRYRVLKSPEEMYWKHFPVKSVQAGEVDANRFFGTGWEWLDMDHPARWSQGLRSVLYLPLRADHSYHITMCMKTLEGINDQNVLCYLNGNRIGECNVGSALYDFEVDLSHEFIRDGCNEIVLSVAKAMSPFQLGLSQDKRPLGISLANFSISEYKSEAAPKEEEGNSG